MMSKQLQIVISDAFSDASVAGYEYLTVEQLLLSLLKDKTIIKILSDFNVNFEDLFSVLNFYVEENVTFSGEEEGKGVPEPTIAFHRVIERAIMQVQSAEKEEVTCADVLVSILNEQESEAVYLLNELGVDWLKLTRYLSHEQESLDDLGLSSTTKSKDTQSCLERYTTNLNELAKQGKIDPLIGRELDIERVMQVLSRRRKNNPILVGESGVGKTAIAEGLAWLIEQRKVPKALAKATVYSFDISALIAGATYRGDFEKRFNDLVKELEQISDSILFIDEIHMIIGAGSASDSKLDTANLFKPLLSSGKIRVMGSTTYQEYSQVFEKDHALTRRFQKIDIVEPSLEDSVKILHGLKSYYEQFHNITYTDAALRSAVELSIKYLPERFLPDKAIDLIDEAGAKNSLLSAKKRKKIIDVTEIESIVAKIARIPEKTVSVSDKSKLQSLNQQLQQQVFGQEQAIDVLSDAITLNRAGLGRDNKPIGAFLFAGPTGVGKTEITVQLAKNLGVELLRFDMSEYREAHTISRLIGSPPGYVGFEQGGLLTDQVIKHPYAVLLLDEIEKAHPDIYNLLLQIMDNGTLTDSNGRKADFRNIVLVMTTNAGVHETVKSSIGFSVQDNSHDALSEINRVFSPEFRNRLDNIIWFKHLTQPVILQVANKFISELQTQLKAKQVKLTVSAQAKEWLAQKGYDKTMGARPMNRVIQEQLKKPIAKELLFGQLQQGGAVKVSLKDQQLVLAYSA